jgi:hypothetical protein
MHFAIRLLFLFLVAFITSGCAKTTTIRHSLEYEDITSRSHEILILPAAAEVNTIDASNRKERMYDYEQHLEALIHQEIVPIIQARGFRVKVLHKRDIREQKLNDLVINLRRSYDAAREELYHPAIWEESKAFVIEKNLGPSAALLQEKTNTDLLLIIDYAGAVRTNGARALHFAADLVLGTRASNNTDNSVMIIGFVDARSGNVVWTNMASVASGLFDSALDNFSSRNKVDTKKVNSLMTNAIAPFAKR